MRKAARRRRERDVGALALGLASLMNRIPFASRAVRTRDLAGAMLAYEPEDDDGEG